MTNYIKSMLKTLNKSEQRLNNIIKNLEDEQNKSVTADMRQYIEYKNLYIKDLYITLMNKFNINVCIQNKHKIQNPTTVRLERSTVQKLRKLVYSGVTINETLDRILELLDKEVYLKDKIQNWQDQEQNTQYPNLEDLKS